MGNSRRTSKGRYFKKAVVYFLTWCMVVNAWLPAVMALEVGDMTGNNGLISPTQWGDHTIIDTGHGAIINASRSILYAFDSHPGGASAWEEAVAAAAESAAAELEAVRHEPSG